MSHMVWHRAQHADCTPHWLWLAQVRPMLPMQDINLAASCMRLLEAHLDDWGSPDGSKGEGEQMLHGVPCPCCHPPCRCLHLLLASLRP